MAKLGQNSGIDEKRSNRKVDAFIKSLSTEQKMLIVLKAQLYGGSWEPMHKDLKNRLQGKPYIFKLANRINDDVERIEEMQKFEEKHEVDLADYIDSLE
ncbi:MAG: hypothetical protein K8R02_04905 [Anaerohalosphaeraceae bacterium]|nr:hypothetical protein [Anaerohalosphaeraceae bacterium]